MSVRCKFRVLEITDRYQHSHAETGDPIVLPTVRLVPVSGKYNGGTPNEENKAFWQATPSGEITLTITNPAASRQFEVGRCYYVDFEPAPE